MVFGKYWMKNMKVSSKESEEISEKTKEIQSLTQLLRFILVFLANQRFVFLICFTVFYKF